MSLPIIAEINISTGTIYNVETAVNALINQRIVSAESSADGQMKLVTSNGTEILIPVPYAHNGLVSGMAITRTAARDYQFAAGNYQIGGETLQVTPAVTVTLSGQHSTLPRVDAVVGNKDQTTGDQGIAVISGTAAADPLLPAIPAGSILLASIWVDPLTNLDVDRILVENRLGVSDPTLFTFEKGKIVIEAYGLDVRVAPISASDDVTSVSDLDPAIPLHYLDTSTGGSFIYSLPADPTLHEGKSWDLQDTGNAAVASWTISGNGNNVNGVASIVISTAYQRVTVSVKAGVYYASV